MVCGIHNTNQFEGIQVAFTNIDKPYESFVSSIYKISLFFKSSVTMAKTSNTNTTYFQCIRHNLISHVTNNLLQLTIHPPSAYQRPLPVQQEPPSNNQQPLPLQQMMQSSETTSVLPTGFQYKVNLIDTHPLTRNVWRPRRCYCLAPTWPMGFIPYRSFWNPFYEIRRQLTHDNALMDAQYNVCILHHSEV